MDASATQVDKRAENRAQWLASARKVLEIEGNSILAAAGRLDAGLIRAVELILEHPGKMIVTGIGKSGHVARKVAATLQSTGTPAVFLHPAEAAHGDLGVLQPGDPVLMVSKSGATAELIELIPALKEFRPVYLGILGNVSSPLAKAMDVVLDASIQREADPDGFVPTASSAVALSIGHALAVALMQARGFSSQDFSRNHGGGHLGRTLRTHVAEVMHSGDEVAWVKPDDSLKQVVIAMSKHPLGGACVLAQDGRLVGLVTDGDVRRALQAHDDIRPLCAADVMTKQPSCIGPQALLQTALAIMEDRPSQISVLPVVEDGKCVGLLRLHDIYRAGE